MTTFSKIPQFKLWLTEKGLSQKKLCELTKISSLPINTMVNTGKASKATVNHVARALSISEEELIELLITEDNQHLYQD